MIFDVGAAVGAGLIGGAVMSALLYMGVANQPSNKEVILMKHEIQERG